MRRLAIGLLLAAASLVLAGVAGEAVLRLFPSLISREVLIGFNPDLRGRIAVHLKLPTKQARRCLGPAERSDGGPELCLMPPGYVHRPGADRADLELGAVLELPQDAKGFCNPPAAEREYATLVVLGDSFTWCSFVPPEATYTALLGQELGQVSYNLGFPAIGPYDHLEIFRKFGAALRPSIVVLSFYEGNDLRDTLRFVHWREEQGPAESTWRQLIRANSYFVNFVAGSIRVLVSRHTKPRVDHTYTVPQNGQEVAMNVTGAELGEAGAGRRLLAGEIDLSVLRAPIRQFHELARSNAFVPVLAYLPSASTAFASSARFADGAVREAAQELSRRQRTALADLAREQGIAYVDCTPLFQAEAPTGELAYFPANLHFTRRGHALAATCLRDMLRDLLREGVVESPPPGERAG